MTIVVVMGIFDVNIIVVAMYTRRRFSGYTLSLSWIVIVVAIYSLSLSWILIVFAMDTHGRGQRIQIVVVMDTRFRCHQYSLSLSWIQLVVVMDTHCRCHGYSSLAW